MRKGYSVHRKDTTGKATDMEKMADQKLIKNYNDYIKAKVNEAMRERTRTGSQKLQGTVNNDFYEKYNDIFNNIVGEIMAEKSLLDADKATLVKRLHTFQPMYPAE